MKLLYTLAVLLVTGYAALGQTKKAAPDAVSLLPPFINIIETCRTDVAFAVALSGINEDKAIAPAKAAMLFDSIASTPRPKPESIYNPVFNLFVKNRYILRSYINVELIMGSEPVVYFLANEECPIYFSNKNGALNLHIQGLAYSKVFNTLSTTARKRASYVATKMLTPAIKDARVLTNIQGLKTISYTVAYECRDFSDDHAKELYTDKTIESLTMVVPVNLIRKYADGGVSEDALIKASEFYVKPREGNSGDIKRIEISVD